MPLYPPRTETVKKSDLLVQRELELIQAIKTHSSIDKINKLAEKYRFAQLSLLKAKIHFISEMENRDKPCNMNREKIENEKLIWTNKTIEDIIIEIKGTI